METLKATNITVGKYVIPVFANSSNEYFFSQQSLELILGNPDRSIRDFLCNKSPEALRCNGLTSGKSAKIAGEKTTVKIVPILIVENYLLYQSFKGNIVAQTLIREFSALGLHTYVATAFGETITKVEVDAWNRLRACMRQDFQPLLASWNKYDGAVVPYGGFVNNFKRAAKVDLVHPDDMSPAMLDRYDSMIKAYDLLRKLGLSDQDARRKLTELY